MKTKCIHGTESAQKESKLNQQILLNQFVQALSNRSLRLLVFFRYSIYIKMIVKQQYSILWNSYNVMEFNRLIAYQQTKRNWNIHEKHLKSIKSTINTGLSSAPKSTERLKSLTRKTLSKSRMMDIQFENRALLNKLTHQKLKPNLNQTCIKLKKNNRKKYYEEHQRRIENAGLLRRIQCSKPSYQAEAYAQQYRDSKRYANMICRFPYQGEKPTKSLVKLQMENDVSKYFAVSKQNKENETDRKNNRMKVPEKIVRVHEKQSKILGTNKDAFVIHCIEMETKMVLEISGNSNIYRLEISKETYLSKYGGDFKKLCDKVQYVSETQELCLG